MQEERANPDELLKRIEEETIQSTRGKLKIFFGYAAGVGKTYAMLEAAHVAKERGIDVVLGYVEPHQRPQTSALLHGLESIRPKKIIYRGIEVEELDLDGAMERNPQLIVVDELAHSNTEGSRHKKRYQDIEELLKCGIDVYTTINVQHLESLNDVVFAITGVPVRERIPDSVFDGAKQVELVDIEPEELIVRLEAGKIYKSEQAQRALQNFFCVKNLAALREIALRRCADRVNHEIGKEGERKEGDYYTQEHILVCLSASPTNPKIIRTGARMADAFRGRFTALFVETPEFENETPENKASLRDNMRLAQQLGASIESVRSDDVSLQIAEFARCAGVSKVVIGRNRVGKKYFWTRQSLTEKLLLHAPTLDIYIIPDKENETSRYYTGKKQNKSVSVKLVDVMKSLLILGGVTLIGFLFFVLGFSEANIITVYILGVLITAIVTSQRVYSLVSSIVSVLTFNFFFTVPRYTFHVNDAGYPATFCIMFVAAFLTSTLAVKIKHHARQSAERAYRTKILLDTNQILQKESSAKGIASAAARQLQMLLNRDVLFYIAQDKCLEEPMIFSELEDVDQKSYASANEKAVATWVMKNNKHAGAGTNTLGNAKCLYLAVRVNETVYGVVGIVAKENALDSFENSIMLSILGECALALESERAMREREQAAVLAKNEQLRANLLRAISHDLRTPLTSISGNAGILLASAAVMEDAKKEKLYTDIYEESLWLINLVENLLSITRIQEQGIKLNLTSELMDEMITEALNHIHRTGQEHEIIVEPSNEFLFVEVDVRLIVQVIINIVDNALKYTPVDSLISIKSRKVNGKVSVEIADEGEGISDEAKERIFDMFYTAGAKSADSRRSLGLGLSLCKSILQVHGGEITVEDNKPRGTIFRFVLPEKEIQLHE